MDYSFTISQILTNYLNFFYYHLLLFFHFLFFFIGSKKKDIDNKIAYTLLFSCLLMIGQPIAAGPDGSLGNVVRIANLCFPILTLVIFYIFDFSNFLKKIKLFF